METSYPTPSYLQVLADTWHYRYMHSATGRPKEAVDPGDFSQVLRSLPDLCFRPNAGVVWCESCGTYHTKTTSLLMRLCNWFEGASSAYSFGGIHCRSNAAALQLETAILWWELHLATRAVTSHNKDQFRLTGSSLYEQISQIENWRILRHSRALEGRLLLSEQCETRIQPSTDIKNMRIMPSCPHSRANSPKLKELAGQLLSRWNERTDKSKDRLVTGLYRCSFCPSEFVMGIDRHAFDEQGNGWIDGSGLTPIVLIFMDVGLRDSIFEPEWRALTTRLDEEEPLSTIFDTPSPHWGFELMDPEEAEGQPVSSLADVKEI